MSDPVQMALIAAGIPAVVSIVGAYFSYKASVIAGQTRTIAEKTEQNTNHMKDELVAAIEAKSTLKESAAHAAGVIQGEGNRQG
jgi:hypothetical protein